MTLVSIEDVETLASDIELFLDAPKAGADFAFSSIPIRGWVCRIEKPIDAIHVRGNGRLLKSLPVSVSRPILNQRFGFDDDCCLGFQDELSPSDLDGRFELIMAGSSGEDAEETPLWKITGLANSDPALKPLPKLFFMHIAKTAGSSVNAFIERQYPAGASRSHIEALHLRKVSREEAIEGKCFLSGHVALDVALKLNYVDKSFTFFTILRRPMEQLLSHLSWVRNLSLPEKEESLAAHPEHIRKISNRLFTLSFAEFFESMSSQEKDLFDNVQTRYLAHAFGRDLANGDCEKAVKCLNRFKVLGINERLDDSLRLLSRIMGWPEPEQSSPRENVSTNRLRLKDFTPEEIELLQRLIRYDNRVYKRGEALFLRQWERAFNPPEAETGR